MARSNRDEFPRTVTEALGKRVAYRCSKPDCRLATSGPSDTRVSRVANTGEAAHISGAASGGPRYDASLTPAERKSLDNGVWLCSTHAKLIDTDETRWPAALLRSWRLRAEELAAIEQRTDPFVGLSKRMLISWQRSLPLDQEALRQVLHDFLGDIGASDAWGDHYELGRMLLYELALNAVTHGGATELTISSCPDAVSVIADGAAYGLDNLRASRGKGGTSALSALERHAVGTFAATYRRSDGVNEWSVVDEIASEGTNTPCSMRFDHPPSPDELTEALRDLGGCEEIHVYPQTLWSFSDWHSLLSRLTGRLTQQVLVIHGVAKQPWLVDLVQKEAPRARIAD